MHDSQGHISLPVMHIICWQVESGLKVACPPSEQQSEEFMDAIILQLGSEKQPVSVYMHKRKKIDQDYNR